MTASELALVEALSPDMAGDLPQVRLLRQPTPLDIALAWYRAALAGRRPQITSEPQAGYFERKLVKDGPRVGARIWLHQETCPETGELIADEYLRCEVDGIEMDVDEQWPWLADRPIPEGRYRYLEGLRNWAAWHSPNDPAANPKIPLNPLTTPIQF